MSKAKTMMRLVPTTLSKLTNFTSIRILNPEPSLWFDISIVDSLMMRVVSGNHAYFRSLDIGDLNIPRIQGLAFTRGFFKPLSLDFDLDRPMSKHDYVSQRVIIENASVGIDATDMPADRISKVLASYKDDIFGFLRDEYASRVPFPLININAGLKGDNDLKMILDFAPQPSPLYKPPFLGAFQYIPIQNITLSSIDLFAPLDQSTVDSTKPGLIESAFNYSPIILNNTNGWYRVVKKSDEFLIKALYDFGASFVRFQVPE